MADAIGEAKEPPLRVTFDRRIKLEFHGARITSDGLLAYRELDDALGLLTATAASTLTEGQHSTNIRHRLLGLLRQAIYGRLAVRGDIMREIGAFGAKSRLGQVLDWVEAGEVVITRRSKVVTKVVSPGAGSTDRERAQAAAARIRTMRHGVILGGELKLKELIAEGRPTPSGFKH